MNNLPRLSESELRGWASAQSMARARSYFEDGSVYDLVWRDGLLTAAVQGSAYEPYQVTIQFANGNLSSALCTCPYDYGNDCKHIIATLLTLIHTPEELDERKPLADLLAPLTREQLIDLVTRLASRQPHVGDEIEQLLATAAAPSAPVPSPTAQPTVDTTLLRRQIKAELRASIDTGYDYFGEEAWYDSDLSAALEPGLAQVRTHLAANDAKGALVLLAAICEGWQDGIDSLDEYYMEYFDEVAGEFTWELGELWAEAILTADIDADMEEAERLSWAENLDALSESMFGGDSLLMAVTAAEQGWDYAPLRAAMAGTITEKGAWEDEAPDFADELARVRLRILERRGDYEAYLNLAQAEGAFMLYLHMLAKQGQSDLAMAEARQYLTQPTDFHALSRTLAAAGEQAKALQLAQDGLNLAEGRGKAELAAWLRDQAREMEEDDLALWAAQQAFAYEISLANYRVVQELAGEEWQALKTEMLANVADSRDANGKVDIYLHEGMNAEAIATVDNAQWFYNMDKVIEGVKESHPEWAFRQCKKQADAIMDAGRSQNYDVAAAWLRRGREILLAAGLDKMWSNTITHLMDVHARKYKLMPMLRALA